MLKNKKEKGNKRIALWAVDPFEEGVSLNDSTVARLAATAKSCGCALVPVHVISPALGRAQDSDAVEARMVDYLARLQVPGLAAPRVLIDDTFPRQTAVHTLSELARKEHAAWIAVSSHGRHGLRRLVLGSFAEKLLAETTLPLLFLSHGAPSRRNGEKIIFPTDFSRGSWNAFTRFLPVARQQGMEIVLFHLLSFPTLASNTSSGMIPFIPEGFFGEQEAKARKLAARWLTRAREAGVPARLLLKDGGLAAMTGADVMTAAEEESAGSITVAAEAGAVGRLLAGSAAFDIFRSGKFFVWAYGPKACASPLRQSFRRAQRPSGKAKSASPGSARYTKRPPAPPRGKAR